ncbi:MAG: hypothetical protein NC301_07390 [Bacteroides sp.]|nr:hypothetical protein [Bacteroides sp.]MCM1380010.1 hypothetical protein [Bacteroides sp.]MCM1446310.1 hypothetical protein [Prevotella sp.]
MKQASILFYLLSIIFLSSCRTIEYVPVENSHDFYHTLHSSDTLLVRDSVIIDRAGDTIRELRWRDRWRVSVVRDTVMQTDTITQVVNREVPAKLTPWQRVKLSLGGWALLALAFTTLLYYRKMTK